MAPVCQKRPLVSEEEQFRLTNVIDDRRKRSRDRRHRSGKCMVKVKSLASTTENVKSVQLLSSDIHRLRKSVSNRERIFRFCFYLKKR